MTKTDAYKKLNECSQRFAKTATSNKTLNEKVEELRKIKEESDKILKEQIDTEFKKRFK